MGVQHRNFVLAVSALAIAATATKPLLNPIPLFVWNATNSVPIGSYLVSKRQPNFGKSLSSDHQNGSKSMRQRGAICLCKPRY